MQLPVRNKYLFSSKKGNKNKRLYQVSLIQKKIETSSLHRASLVRKKKRIIWC